jgi:quercetin dioxygenase-like cupin family protein
LESKVSENTISDSGLAPVRRVVTGHNEQGLSQIKMEDTKPTTLLPNGDGTNLLLWSTESVPANNNDERDGRDLETMITIDRGTAFRMIDILPGKESPMHRTNSIDYGIVLQGEVEMELEDGSKTTIKQGEVIVQRGTNHLWRNTTDVPVRIAFVLIEAGPYIYNGKPLSEDKA